MNRVKSWRLNHFYQSLVSKLNLIFVIIVQLMMEKIVLKFCGRWTDFYAWPIHKIPKMLINVCNFSWQN